MTVEQEILTRVTEQLTPIHVTIENESYMHNVPVGSESHFKLVVVSPSFEGKRPVQRHQMVYGALAEQMSKIHALALHVYTSDEWEAQTKGVPNSPNCMGGGH